MHRLRLLQSTIVGKLNVMCRLAAFIHISSVIPGVVLLHLLLIPGVSFFVQGTQVYEQKLSPQFNLNHSLLMTGFVFPRHVAIISIDLSPQSTWDPRSDNILCSTRSRFSCCRK